MHNPFAAFRLSLEHETRELHQNFEVPGKQQKVEQQTELKDEQKALEKILSPETDKSMDESVGKNVGDRIKNAGQAVEVSSKNLLDYKKNLPKPESKKEELASNQNADPALNRVLFESLHNDKPRIENTELAAQEPKTREEPQSRYETRKSEKNEPELAAKENEPA